jgi:hypothetical protein
MRQKYYNLMRVGFIQIDVVEYTEMYYSLFTEVDVVALIQCTSPFLNASFLAEAYSKMHDGMYDCVFSVTREYKLRWKKLPGMVSYNLFNIYFKIMHKGESSHHLLNCVICCQEFFRNTD